MIDNYALIFRDESDSYNLISKFEINGPLTHLYAPEVLADLVGFGDDIDRNTILFVEYQKDPNEEEMNRVINGIKITVTSDIGNLPAAEFVRAHAEGGTIQYAANDLFMTCLTQMNTERVH